MHGKLHFRFVSDGVGQRTVTPTLDVEVTSDATIQWVREVSRGDDTFAACVKVFSAEGDDASTLSSCGG